MKFQYDEKKHGNPLFEYSLDKFYFIIHDGKLKIFEKGDKEGM